MKPAFLALVLLAALAAQGPPPLPDPDGPKTPVSGRVLTSGDQPVRGAKVVIQAMGGAELETAFSDGDGRWTVPDAPVGDFSIRADKSGYSPEYSGILIPPTGKLSGVDLQIHRFAVISGRVTDHRDRPVVGARVELLTEEVVDGQVRYLSARIRNMGRRLTDDRGLYRVWNLTPGRYRIAITPPPAQAADGVIRLKSAPALYPGVASADEAESVALTWGAVRQGLDVRLPRAANTSVEVTMSFEQGPCPRCSLNVYGAGANAALAVAHGYAHAGLYRIDGLPAGDYRLAVRGADERSRMALLGLAPITIREGRIESARVTVARPAPLEFRVVLEDPPDELLADDGEPWRSSLLLEPSPEDRRVVLRTREMFGRVQSSGREARGEMATLPGRWQLQIQPPAGAYVAGVSLDGRPLRNGWLDPPPEGFSGELVVRLRFDPGKIEGRLSKTSSPPGAGLQPARALIFIETDPPGSGFLQTRSRSAQPDGSFAFDLPPGVYQIAAIERESFQRLYQSGLQERELRDRLKRVAVKAGETVNVTLDPPE